MLLAARENGATERNGCVALSVSDDLAHWEYRRPLYAPRTHQGAYECPDFFKMGDWYYLVYSSYMDGFSTYCISSSVFPKNRKEKFPILGIGYSHISAGNIFI